MNSQTREQPQSNAGTNERELSPIPKRRRGKLLFLAVLVAALPFSVGLALFGVSPFVDVGLRTLGSFLPHDLTNGHADLRTDLVRNATAEDHERGRHVLEALAVRHGLDAWQEHEVLRVVATDEWSGDDGWWPQATQRFSHVQLLDTFTSKAQLHGGSGDGEVWGIQTWSPWLSTNSQSEPEWISKDHTRFDAIRFYLPTLQYFNELVFRLRKAPIAIYAGSEVLHGQAYHKVYVTWEEGPPTGTHDHYVLWIDESSGLLAKVHYTIREAPDFAPAILTRVLRAAATGTMHYTDYREVDGVQFSFDQIVTVFGPAEATADPSSDFFHRLKVESVSFEPQQADSLVLDPTRGEPGDRKL